MGFAEFIENLARDDGKTRAYRRGLLLCLGLSILYKAVYFSGLVAAMPREILVDFDSFYVASRLVIAGEIEKTYYFATMYPAENALLGSTNYVGWAYPPQFELIILPLALMQEGIAFLLFIGASFLAYVTILARMAGRNLLPILILLLLPIQVNIASGQNGFLTAALIGLTCLLLQRRRAIAGLPLGLLIIKPHLAVAFAVYCVASGRWRTVAVAAATVIGTSLLATLIFGAGVWPAYLDGTRDASQNLSNGLFPLFRMISVFSALMTSGAPFAPAMAMQLVVTTTTIGAVIVAALRFPVNRALAVTVFASLLISPYAYDYDMPMLAIGLALLLPDLSAMARPGERAGIYLALFVTGAFGYFQTVLPHDVGPAKTLLVYDLSFVLRPERLSLAGIALAFCFALIWHVCNRDWRARPQTV